MSTSIASRLTTVRNGFFSVPARRSGRVVCRVSSYASVWAWRAPRKGDRPSPACLFFPSCTLHTASGMQEAARFLGWPATLKKGRDCACFADGPMSTLADAWVCKVQLPAGIRTADAHEQLRAAHSLAFEAMCHAY